MRLKECISWVTDRLPQGMEILQRWLSGKVVVSCSAFLVYLACAEDIQGVWRGWLSQPIEYVYRVVEDSFLVNVWLSILFVAFFLRQGCAIYRDAYFSLYRLLGFVLLTMVTFYQSPWLYAKSFQLIGFDWLIAVPSALIALIELRKGCCRQKPNDGLKGEKAAFTTDKPLAKGEASQVIQDFTTSLSAQLLNTDIHRDSFALCVTGSWGSGKTTFLRSLEEDLKEQAIVVQFNPWNSSSAEQLVTDFFNVLNKQVSKYYSSLDKRISHYAQTLIQSYSSSVWLAWFTAFNRPMSLEKQKSEIATAISKLPQRVVVLIDDMDRLDADEIMEVLRLIRNTAQFSNMLFIAAFDKGYVNSLLFDEESKSNEYIEKIFPVEIALPTSDSLELWECLTKEVRLMYRPTGKINSMFGKMSWEEKKMIVAHCSTYRKCKRFARQFVAVATYMQHTIKGENFLLRDLFYIELLHAYYPDVYENISRHPGPPKLKKATNSRSGQYVWLYEAQENPILKMLFGDTDKANVSPVGIASYESFSNYFSLTIPHQVISHSDFSAMLDSKNIGEEMKHCFTHWFCGSKYRKDGSTLYNHFCYCLQHLSKSEEKVRRLFHALLYWFEYDDKHKDNQIKLFKQILNISIYRDKEMRKRAADLYNNKLLVFSKSNMGNSIKLAQLLSSLLRFEDQEQRYVLSVGEIMRLMNENIQVVLNRRDWDAICVLLDDNNSLNLTLRASLVRDGNQTVSVVMDTVMAYFKQEKHKSHNRERLQPYCRAMQGQSASEGAAQDRKALEEQVLSVFGTLQQGRDMFKEFAEGCFVSI